MDKGRPIEWTPEKKQNAIDEIFQKITEGKSLRQILDHDETLPSRRLFYEWLALDKELSNHYAQVTMIRADVIFDEIIDIADDTTQDQTDIGEGLKVTNYEAIQRSRLKVDARKWVIAKMMPRKYGDKIDVTTDGNEIKHPQTIINLGSGIKPNEE